MKQAGADFIKVCCSRFQYENLSAVVEEAHKLNLRVTGHWPDNLPIQAGADLGMDGFEHQLPVYRQPEYEQLQKELAARRGTPLQADLAEILARQLYLRDDQAAEQVYRSMAAKSVWLTPTIASFAPGVALHDLSQDPRQVFVFPAIWDNWGSDPKLGSRKPLPEGRARDLIELTIKRNRELLLIAYKAGVPMLAGTDCGAYNPYIPGWFLHDELESLVAAGIPPADALRIAPINAARWRGEADSDGSVEKGKVADLVLLRSNPLEAIRHTREIEAVVQHGKYYSRMDLDAMLQQVAKRSAAARQ